MIRLSNRKTKALVWEKNTKSKHGMDSQFFLPSCIRITCTYGYTPEPKSKPRWMPGFELEPTPLSTPNSELCSSLGQYGKHSSSSKFNFPSKLIGKWVLKFKFNIMLEIQLFVAHLNLSMCTQNYICVFRIMFVLLNHGPLFASYNIFFKYVVY